VEADLKAAIAWLGDRWVLAEDAVRLDRQPQPEPRPVPWYIEASQPMFLRHQA